VREPFNAHWITCQLVVLNEVHTFSRREFMNKLKPLLAAPPDTLMVNRKNVPQFSIPNIINVIMFTNHEDALAPTQGDRRYWIHRCLIEERPPKAHFNALYAWLNAGGDAKVFGWLLARDLSQFDDHEPAPMTQAKQAMIDQSQPRAVRWCREQFREGGQFEGRTIITADEVASAAPLRIADDLNHKRLATALGAEGYQTADNLRVRNGKDLLRLWVRDPSGLLMQLSPAALRERHRAEAGPSPSEAFG
jgi:hypothetical protein